MSDRNLDRWHAQFTVRLERLEDLTGGGAQPVMQVVDNSSNYR